MYKQMRNKDSEKNSLFKAKVIYPLSCILYNSLSSLMNYRASLNTVNDYRVVIIINRSFGIRIIVIYN